MKFTSTKKNYYLNCKAINFAENLYYAIIVLRYDY